ncbi:coiled-coil domain-containing protein 42 [Pterocles gutturalis]
MATVDDEDLVAYFSMQYRQNLLPLLRKLKLTEKDSPSPFIRLQEKKKQAQLMHKTLEEKQEEFKEQLKVMICRWRVLLAKDAELKTDMEKSARILKEKYKMQTEALKKASKERERKMLLDSELLRAKRELEVLREKHQKLYNKVQKFSIFKKYLEDVVKISQFEDVQEVICRYKKLLRIRKDLLQSQQEHKEMCEQAKETRWADIQNMTAERTRKLGTIKMAILSLFQSMSEQLKES